MGTDNLFHRHKARKTSDLKRKKPKRLPYDKVLIVCEGEKTEPNYFNELKDHYEISSANVAVDGTSGSSPKNVFEYAVHLYESEKTKGDPFDRVYCVFDRDSHTTYEQTLQKISTQQPRTTFFAITSTPCFEYWLVLHFKYTTRPYATTGSSSIGGVVLQDLKTVMPDYEKGNTGTFLALLENLDMAIAYAKRSLTAANNNHHDNSSTKIHKLVTYLQNIKAVT